MGYLTLRNHHLLQLHLHHILRILHQILRIIHHLLLHQEQIQIQGRQWQLSWEGSRSWIFSNICIICMSTKL
ncbi:hypothetical protein Hanom_Chr13g01209601 [Helianthus anomalus]